MGLMSVLSCHSTRLLLSTFTWSCEAFSSFFKFFLFLSLYLLLRTQEAATHPWYNVSTLRHHFGASSPGILKKHCCEMKDPSSISHPFTIFFCPFSCHCKRATWSTYLLKSQAKFQNQLSSVYYLSEPSLFQQKLAPHIKHVGAQRASSISCHNVDLCWEGIPHGVEANLHAKLTWQLPADRVWMWRHFFTVPLSHFCYIYSFSALLLKYDWNTNKL